MNIIGTNIGIKLMNGKIKPKKKGIKTYITIIIFTLLLIAFFIVLLYGLINFNIEYILWGSISTLATGYILLISAYTQNSNNYYIKFKNQNSFEGIELYYKKKQINLKFLVDQEGKFKWANNNSKLKCVSYFDGSHMSNFTKYRIINYFSAWLLENDYLSKEVTVTFEKI